MNKQEIAEAIIVMQACIDGEEIDVETRGVCDVWVHVVDTGGPRWNWEVCNYRIRPKEPREFKIMVMGDGYIHDVTKQERGFLGEVIKVREVLKGTGGN